MSQQIMDLILYLIPVIIGVIFGIKPVRAYFLNNRSKTVRQVVDIVYFAVKNLKRNYEKNIGQKMQTHKVKQNFESLVSAELKNHGIKPTGKVLEQAKTFAEARHAELKLKKIFK